MKKVLIFMLVLPILVVTSCKKEVVGPAGNWSPILDESQREIRFKAEGDSILVRSLEDWWYIYGISLNGDWNYGSDVTGNTSDYFIINKKEVKIEKRGAKNLFIKMSENLTDSVRVLIIDLYMGDVSDYIRITQSKK